MYVIHAILVDPFLVPFSWRYVGLAVALYLVRMLALSGGYRYFAHRATGLGRAFQFVIAFLGGTCSVGIVVGGQSSPPPPVLRRAG
jgi:stearoyl-CoA desaturase (delta-9 desaturase)